MAEEELYLCEFCTSVLSVVEFHTHKCEHEELPAKSWHLEDTSIEILIGLVQNHRPLWHHRLPISFRGKNEKDKLWLEIWKEMGGTFTMETLQKKWKNLRDQFMKTKTQLEIYVPSGSATQSKKKVWKHYESMKFLQDTVQPKPTSSNLEIATGSPVHSSDESTKCSVVDIASPTSSNGVKKRRKQENFEESLLRILDKPIPIQAATPQLSPSMVLATSLLNELPPGMRMKAERDFLNKLYDMIDEYNSIK